MKTAPSRRTSKWLPSTSPKLFLLRRAAAFQAWYECMPVRRALLPRGPDHLAYRRIVIGDLVSLNVLDTRLFRSDQPCGDGVKAEGWEALAPDRTMLGDAGALALRRVQEYLCRLAALGQQVMDMRHDRDPDPTVFAPSLDKWDGAVAARDRLLAAVEDTKLANLVVLTGTAIGPESSRGTSQTRSLPPLAWSSWRRRLPPEATALIRALRSRLYSLRSRTSSSSTTSAATSAMW